MESFLPHQRSQNKKAKQKILANSGGVAVHIFAYTCKIQKTIPVLVDKTRRKNEKILASSGGVALLTTAYIYLENTKNLSHCGG